MSSQQRIEVWKGHRLKTSGGLFKKDLVKNKRGKIVSKKKSVQARDQNNLGDFLRKLDEKVSKKEMLHSKKGAAAAPKKPAAVPKKPAAPKAVKAPVAKPKAKPAAPAAKAPAKVKPVPQKKVQGPPKKKLPKGYNPLTRQPYEKKSGLGYVFDGSVNLDNIITGKRRRRKRVNYKV